MPSRSSSGARAEAARSPSAKPGRRARSRPRPAPPPGTRGTARSPGARNSWPGSRSPRSARRGKAAPRHRRPPAAWRSHPPGQRPAAECAVALGGPAYGAAVSMGARTPRHDGRARRVGQRAKRFDQLAHALVGAHRPDEREDRAIRGQAQALAGGGPVGLRSVGPHVVAMRNDMELVAGFAPSPYVRGRRRRRPHSGRSPPTRGRTGCDGCARSAARPLADRASPGCGRSTRCARAACGAATAAHEQGGACKGVAWVRS